MPRASCTPFTNPWYHPGSPVWKGWVGEYIWLLEKPGIGKGQINHKACSSPDIKVGLCSAVTAF